MSHNLTTYNDFAAATACKILLAECLTLERPGLTVPGLARALNVSAERCYKWLNPQCLSNNFPIHLLPAWDSAVGPRLLQHICHAAGYRPPIAIDLCPVDAPPLRLALDATALCSSLANELLPHAGHPCPHQVRKRVHALCLTITERLLTLAALVDQDEQPPAVPMALERRTA